MLSKLENFLTMTVNIYYCMSKSSWPMSLHASHNFLKVETPTGQRLSTWWLSHPSKQNMKSW